MRFRVLWTDAAGEGRFSTVDAASAPAAAWQAAIDTESAMAKFEAIEQIKEPAVRGSKAARP